MQTIQQFTAIIEREGDGYVSLCPELELKKPEKGKITKSPQLTNE
ncbi:MAG: hypothetical protein QNJ42_05140 [Crocosphaera sp.]|nr:hypothetical protein [Crocosphaera sp.]